MTLSEKITYYRKKAMLSQEALAEKLGVSRQAVSKWETGESTPELNKMAALAKVLNTSVDWLLSPDAPEEEPKAQQHTESTTYPDWLHKMPSFIQKVFYRWGWLSGVYVAVGGGVFAAIGLLAQYITEVMMSGFKNTALGFGNIYEQFGGAFGEFYTNPVSGMIETMTVNDPVSIIGKFITGLGVLLVLAGIVLAVALKRYGKNKG